MISQDWRCPRCSRATYVEADTLVDVETAMTAVREHHDTVHQAAARARHAPAAPATSPMPRILPAPRP